MIRGRRFSSLLVIGALAACGGGDGGPSGPAPVASVTVSLVNPTVFVGQSVQATPRTPPVR